MKNEFLLKENLPLPKGEAGDLILQTHCHQKSVLGASAEREVLKKLGFSVKEPESGCCGMAGAFGFEPEHVPLAQALGERHLLPAIRQAAAAAPVVASGFSCREQIRQGTEKQPQPIAEIIQKALNL